MDYLAEYNDAMNTLNWFGIREVRDKLHTPQAGQIIQALRNYVNAYLDTLENHDLPTRDTAENTWIVLMRMVDDDFDGLPEP
jgi:hypothetical protein